MEIRPVSRIIICIVLFHYLVLVPAIGTDARTWYYQGGEFLEQGDYPAAIDSFLNAVSLDPEYLDAWLSLAYAYVQDDKLDDAVDSYQHAIAIEPDNTPALKGLAYVYSRLGKDQEALTTIDHAIEVNPHDPSSWLQKGLILSALGRVNESIPVYQKVLELSPDNFDAWLCMGLDYYSGGNYQDALDAFIHALDIDDRSSIAWQYKGDSLSHLGRYSEAIEAYNRGLIVSPGNADLLQRRDAAEAALQRYLEGNVSPSSAPGRSAQVFFPVVLTIAVVVCIGAGAFLFLRRKGVAWMGRRAGPQLTDTKELPAIKGEIPRGTHHDVFISYSSKDKAIADATCAHLESKGIRCWIAPRDVLPGSNYPRSIVEAIDGSRVMVLVFSSNSNTSQHVVRELTHAVSKGVIILPFRIEDVQPSQDMEYLIGLPHWLDAITPPLERHLTYLADTVKTLLRSTEKMEQN
jgi:Tfp pilus assembly protein PilF